MMTASTPRPRENRSQADSKSASSVRWNVSAPSDRARASLDAIDVDAENAAAMGAQQLHGQQADQAEPADDDALAERRLREPHALQRDRGDHREGGLVVADTFGHARAQVDRPYDHLGVRRRSRPRGRRSRSPVTPAPTSTTVPTLQ